MNKILKPVIMVVSAVVLGSFLSACGLGEDQVRVLVQDENGNPVEGATVFDAFFGPKTSEEGLKFIEFMEQKYGVSTNSPNDCPTNKGWKELCYAQKGTVRKTDKNGYAVVNLMTSFDGFELPNHGRIILGKKQASNNQCLIGSNNDVDTKKDYIIVLRLYNHKCYFPFPIR